MPMYEYECTACGHRFERIRKFSDPPVEECPNCGEHKVQKLLSSPAIQFKGTGWYITDYAKSGKTESGGTASANAAKAEAKSDTKAETKTDTKTETKTETKSES